MAFVICPTGGTTIKNSTITVRTGAQRGPLSVRKLEGPLIEPNTLGEVSGNLDSKFDDVNYYSGGTGSY